MSARSRVDIGVKARRYPGWTPVSSVIRYSLKRRFVLPVSPWEGRQAPLEEDDVSAHTEHFPHETDGLPDARRPEVVALRDGDRYALRIAPVVKRIGDATVRMLAYNGSIPGPTLRVAQDSQIEVEVSNDGDHENTVHWHGLRLDNASDGT